ncbi:MAG: chemotaxis protein CheW, partial [Gammaproteobacteria bacterium]
QLDDNNPVTISRDPLITQSLNTEEAYVETFRHSDLLPNEQTPLIYSYRVMTEDGTRPVGVLCLCFRFQDECERIFRGLLEENEWTVLTLLSPEGQVIASSDPYQFPIGAKLESGGDDDECRVIRFAGREYLATTCRTHGYQGYSGPGWLGQALAPLNHAFEMSLAEELDAVPERILEGVLETATLFPPKLRDIPLRAASIQSELNRAVWNGNVWLSRDNYALNTSFAKVLLWEIGSTGMKTRSVFSESTTNLYQTVVSAVLSDCSAQAALAIDIMDRNLYERANDCRWWALTPAFREAMSAGGEPSQEQLTAILRTINGLYTVYSNLLAFDHAGRIIAVSNPSYSDMIGQTLQSDWVRRTLDLPDTQSYCVSDFAPTPLYTNLPTYIYSAAIRDDNGRPAGGIAIVFDSAPQFAAMLEDALPRAEDGGIVDGAFAVFAEKDGRIISSTDPDLVPGMKLEIGREFFELQNGGEYANIVTFRDRYYAVGSRMSAGYREYKSSTDAYRNDLVALILVPLSAQILGDNERNLLHRTEHSNYGHRQTAGEDAVEIATFYIGENWYGVRSQHVIEAIDARDITSIPGMPDWASGCIMHNDRLVTIFDLATLLSDKASDVSAKQIVLLRVPDENLSVGILVDELGEIPEISAESIEPVADILTGGNSLTESLVKPHGEDSTTPILVILSAEHILQQLSGVRMSSEVLGLSYCES